MHEPCHLGRGKNTAFLVSTTCNSATGKTDKISRFSVKLACNARFVTRYSVTFLTGRENLFARNLPPRRILRMENRSETLISPLRSFVELVHYAAVEGNDPQGKMHHAITEGRCSWYPKVGSTSCGDLVQAGLYAAGCREPWINREEHEGWRQGENLYFLCPPFRDREQIDKPGLEDFDLGDIGVYDYEDPPRTHTWVYLGLDEQSRAITADGGQPGIRVRHCAIGQAPWGRVLTFRGRPVDRIIKFRSIKFTAEPELVGHWCYRYGLRLSPPQPLEHFSRV